MRARDHDLGVHGERLNVDVAHASSNSTFISRTARAEEEKLSGSIELAIEQNYAASRSRGLREFAPGSHTRGLHGRNEFFGHSVR